MRAAVVRRGQLRLGLLVFVLLVLGLAGPATTPAARAQAAPVVQRVAGGLGFGDATHVAQTPRDLSIQGGRLFVVDGWVADVPPIDYVAPGIVRAVDLATGRETVVAGRAFAGFNGDGHAATQTTFGEVRAVATEPGGAFYVGDSGNRRVRRVGADGVVTTVIGPQSSATSPREGPAPDVALDAVRQMEVSPDGQLYVLDRGLRRMDAAGDVWEVAPVPAPGEPPLEGVGSFSFDRAGNLYLVETYPGRVRKVSADGVMTTVAGSGQATGYAEGDGGPALAARVMTPHSVAIGPDGSIYIASAMRKVRKVDPGGVITTVAGGDEGGYSGDGGPATAARFSLVSDLAVDGSGDLYIADSGNHRVRRVGTDGIVSTFAGNGTTSFGGDGEPAEAAQMWNPRAIQSGPEGITVIDSGNERVRRFGPSGTTTTLRRSAAAGLARDAQGNLYMSENHRVVKISPGGLETVVAGTGQPGTSGDGGPAVLAHLSYPGALTVDGAGNLFIASGNRIRRVDPLGIITTFAGGQEVDLPFGDDEATGRTTELQAVGSMAVGPDGSLYWLDYDRIRRARCGVITTVITTPLSWQHPSGLAVDAHGTLFVAVSDAVLRGGGGGEPDHDRRPGPRR
jgi:trimeric autotransporter adhesin